MSIMLLIFVYLTMFAGGWAIVTALGVRHPGERLGLGILFSSSLSTYLMFLFFDFFHLPLSQLNVWISVFFLLVIGFTGLFIKKISLHKNVKQLTSWFKSSWSIRKTHPIDFILMIFLALTFFFTLSQNLFWPIFDWDALALYDFRAKVFAQTGGMIDGIQRGYFLHYPPYTSMLHMINYLFNVQQAKVWYSFLFFALILVFYALLRRDTSRRIALLGTTLLAISPTVFSHSQMAYSNLPHAIFTGLGYIYLMLWWRNGRRTDMFVGAFLISFSLWIRTTEPFWLPAVAVIIVGTIKHRRDWVVSIVSLLMLFFVKKPWIDYELYYDHVSPPNPLSATLQISHLVQLQMIPMRLVEVLLFLQRGVLELFKPYILAVAISFLYVVLKKDKIRIAEYGLFLFFVAYIILGTFIFSFGYPGWNAIPDSATRMSMFLLLICIYLLIRSPIWQLSTLRIKTKGSSKKKKKT